MAALSLPDEKSMTQPDFMPFAVPVVQGETDASSAVWQEIRREGTRLTFPAGALIEVSGVHLLDMYCLERGSVRIVFDTLEGRQRALMTFEAGGIFNLACALTRKNASGQYQCMKDSVIWRVPGSTLQDERAVMASPALASYALRQMGTVALIHSTFLSDMLMDDFVIRFCRYLVSLATKHGSTEFPLGAHSGSLRRYARSTPGHVMPRRPISETAGCHCELPARQRTYTRPRQTSPSCRNVNRIFWQNDL